MAVEAKEAPVVTPDDKKKPDEDPQVAIGRVAKAMREEMKDLKTQNALLIDQIELYKANATNAQNVATPAKTTPEEDLLDSIADDDVVDAGTLKKILGKEAAKRDLLIGQLSGVLSEVGTITRFPDYHQVIQTYLPVVLKDDPNIAMAIKNSGSSGPILAYRMAKLAEAAAQKATKEETPPPKNNDQEEIDRIIENALKPRTNVGGVGASVAPGSKYSEDVMDDEAFERHVAQVKAGKFKNK